MEAMVSLRYIQRIDNHRTRTFCWKVEVKRRNEYMHKYFTDGMYGGKEAALAAAIAYRDALLQEVSGVDYRLWLREFKRPHNTSGIVGVGRYVARSGQTEYPYWQASWRDADGKRRSRTFTVSQYGEDEARERACQTRQEGLKEVENVIANRLMTLKR